MPSFLKLNSLDSPTSKATLNQWASEVHQELTMLSQKSTSTSTSELERRLKLLEARVARLENP